MGSNAQADILTMPSYPSVHSLCSVWAVGTWGGGEGDPWVGLSDTHRGATQVSGLTQDSGIQDRLSARLGVPAGLKVSVNSLSWSAEMVWFSTGLPAS